MSAKELLKKPKVLIWIFFIVISIILIGPNINPNGYNVKYIDTTIGVQGINKIATNDVIYSINGDTNVASAVTSNYTGIVTLETNHGEILLRANNTELGLSVEKVPSSNIHLGLDLKGGVRAVIQPIINDTTQTSLNATNVTNTTIDSDMINRIISTLQTRINVFGLREASFRPLSSGNNALIEVTLAGGTRQELTELLERQGKFEAKIPLMLKDGAQLKLSQVYNVQLSNNIVTVNDVSYTVGQSFVLEGIPFSIDGIGDAVNLTATVFTGNDIQLVYFDPQHSSIQQVQNGYEWSFGLQLSNDGAQKFAFITSNLNPTVSGNLDSKLYIYLDGKELDALNIVNALKGQIVREPSVSGFGQTLNDATQSRLRLQSILRSGSLPVSIQIAQLDVISPTLGENFLASASIAGLGAILMVAIVTFIRYRRIKISVPMVCVSLTEVLITIGIATLIGWTIDMPAIAGIIASVGTGIDSIIMITDETLLGKKEELSLTERLKRAFFIVFGAGGTIIAAMLPLTILGFGALRGFAIVTMIGVFVGIFITRSAYGEIVKSIIKT